MRAGAEASTAGRPPPRRRNAGDRGVDVHLPHAHVPVRPRRGQPGARGGAPRQGVDGARQTAIAGRRVRPGGQDCPVVAEVQQLRRDGGRTDGRARVWAAASGQGRLGVARRHNVRACYSRARCAARGEGAAPAERGPGQAETRWATTTHADASVRQAAGQLHVMRLAPCNAKHAHWHVESRDLRAPVTCAGC